ncbi:MAG: restriction endonuclease [Xanthobacteraceae bacterium]|jgi:restriction system protein
MADKSDLPSFDKYFPPTVQSMKHRGGSATIEELEEDVAKIMKLPESILSIPHKTGTRSQFQYELAWVRTYLKKVGLAENSARGVWSLTDAGEKISEKDLFLVPKKVRSTQKAKDPETQPRLDNEEAIEPDWQEQMLGALSTMKPDAFERLCQRILRESGFTRVEVLGQSGDGGIDGIGVLRVNLISFHVLFQCKRWKGSVGASVVRDFRGAMVGRADKGLIITTSAFTADARREATRDGAPAIDLVDGEAICGLLKDLKLGATVKLVEEVQVEPKFFSSI